MNHDSWVISNHIRLDQCKNLDKYILWLDYQVYYIEVDVIIIFGVCTYAFQIMVRDYYDTQCEGSSSCSREPS